MSQADRHEDIYHDDVDRQEFLKTLAEARQKADWQETVLNTMSQNPRGLQSFSRLVSY
jgi:hypothetical protein